MCIKWHQNTQSYIFTTRSHAFYTGVYNCSVHDHVQFNSDTVYSVATVSYLLQVANVVGRAEILCAIWYLMAILIFMRLTKIKNAGPLFWLHSAMVVLFSIVALLCKEQGVTVLGVCAAYDICTKLSYRSIAQVISTRKVKRYAAS